MFADQKQLVKKKLSFNKSSRKKTGGGPFEEKPLSVVEEQILEAAGIDKAVAGLKDVRIFGSQHQQLNVGTYENSSPSVEEEFAESISEIMDTDEMEETKKKNCANAPRHATFTKRDKKKKKTF